MPNIAGRVPHDEFEDMVRRAEENAGPRPEPSAGSALHVGQIIMPVVQGADDVTYPGLPEDPYIVPEIPPELMNPPVEEAPPPPVIEEAPVIPPPLPGFIPRPEEAPVPAPELKSEVGVLDSIEDAQVFEAVAFGDQFDSPPSHSAFGGIVERATQAVERLDLPEGEPAVSPEVREAAAGISGSFHDIGSKISDIGQHVTTAMEAQIRHDDIVEAAEADDVYEADVVDDVYDPSDADGDGQ